jgi:hypothetical protein
VSFVSCLQEVVETDNAAASENTVKNRFMLENEVIVGAFLLIIY